MFSALFKSLRKKLLIVFLVLFTLMFTIFPGVVSSLEELPAENEAEATLNESETVNRDENDQVETDNNLVNPDSKLYSEAGITITGIEQLDLLNKPHNVNLFESLFDGLYDTKGKSNQFVDRHRAWGFHLWYELTLDKRYDLTMLLRKTMAISPC